MIFWKIYTLCIQYIKTDEFSFCLVWRWKALAKPWWGRGKNNIIIVIYYILNCHKSMNCSTFLQQIYNFFLAYVLTKEDRHTNKTRKSVDEYWNDIYETLKLKWQFTEDGFKNRISNLIFIPMQNLKKSPWHNYLKNEKRTKNKLFKLRKIFRANIFLKFILRSYLGFFKI